MPGLHHLALASCALFTSLAFAQTPQVLRDLDAQSRVTLSKEELSQLLPKAKISRLNSRGDGQSWTNDADGTFIVSSDNRSLGGKMSTAPGKWHLSDDGRYCVLIEWNRFPAEEWCRHILKVGADYYATRSFSTETERVYLLQISK